MRCYMEGLLRRYPPYPPQKIFDIFAICRISAHEYVIAALPSVSGLYVAVILCDLVFGLRLEAVVLDIIFGLAKHTHIESEALHIEVVDREECFKLLHQQLVIPTCELVGLVVCKPVCPRLLRA